MANSGQWQISSDGDEAQLHVNGSPVFAADNTPIVVNIDAEISADVEFRRRTVRERGSSQSRSRRTVERTMRPENEEAF